MQIKYFRKVLKQSAAPVAQLMRDQNGNPSVIFAVAMIPIAMIASMAVDYGNSVRIKNELQAAVDAGVLAAATAIATNEDSGSKTAVAESTFHANLSDNTLSGFSATPTTNINFPDKQVTMTVAVTNTRMISTLLADHVDINVTATATVDNGNPICMMALNPTASDALWVNGTADIVANGCSIHVNSDSNTAMRQNGSGTATADNFCVHGDYSGSNFTPTPETDCRVENDPLAAQYDSDLNSVSTTCDYDVATINAAISSGGGGGGNGNNGNGNNGNGNNGNGNNGNGNNGGGGGGTPYLLQPGVYCGGDLSVGTGNTAILHGGGDGNYIIMDGGIDVGSGATLRNYVLAADGLTPPNGVTYPSEASPAETAIVLAGTTSPGVIDVDGQASMEVKAKSTGTFAGIAISQPAASGTGLEHIINGGGTIDINGVVYFPSAQLSIRGNGTIGDSTSQFAIMADTIDVRGNGQLQINISPDYQSAGLPQLPESSERVRLSN